MSVRQKFSNQIRELRQTDSILWMIALGHTFTHWCPATFYLLLPFLVKEMGLTYSQAGFLVTIRAAAPHAEEGVSYGLPAFRINGRPLVCFAAAAHHCSLYPMSPAVIRAHAGDLKKYETSKGTIRFVAPLPAALVRKIGRARLAELEQPRRAVRS